MPRHFDDRERSAIRAALLKKGEELFTAHGLAKVTVDELSRGVKIAKGSFYAFFPSKESLFLAIAKQDEVAMRREVTGTLADATLAPRDQFSRIYAAQLEALERFPILRAASNPDTYALLVRRLPQEAFEDKPDEEFITSLVRNWKKRGFQCRYTVRQLLALSHALFYVYLHRQDGLVGDSLPILLDLVSSSLIKEGSGNE